MATGTTINTQLPPEHLKTVTVTNTEVTISTLHNYRYLLIMAPSTDNTYILTQGIIPIAFAEQYRSVHRIWMINTYDGVGRYYATINVSNINNNKLTVNLSNVSGVYIYGIR